ncbi:MAG: hypothetical protein E7439_02120 [Ruminococcaceae bacterium]|nr:hypothetical protein [Oscillospiraceae bacterium]
MKKLIIALMALAVLFSLAVPAMAASPVKDYASAKDGDLLYTVNFNGDEALTPGYAAKSSVFDITPSADGTTLEVKGNVFNEDGSKKSAGTIWGGTIAGLTADANTKYTMTYQIWMDNDDGGASQHGGVDCFVGVGGMYEGGAKKWMTFTSNYFTATPENRHFSMRRNSGTLKNGDVPYAGVFDAALSPVKDADGFYTMRLTFDGTTATYTAYILTKGTGANESDWTKVIDAPYNIEDNSSMAFAVYTQYTTTHAKIKNVNYYKGLVTGVTASAPSNPEQPDPTADTFSALPVALLVLSGAAVAMMVAKKKEN